MKKNVLKVALMGLAIGSSVCGCSCAATKQMGDEQKENGSCSGKTDCKGKSSCTGKSDCTGSSGCTGKSDDSGTSKSSSPDTSKTSPEMQKKRESAASGINGNKI